MKTYKEATRLCAALLETHRYIWMLLNELPRQKLVHPCFLIDQTHRGLNKTQGHNRVTRFPAPLIMHSEGWPILGRDEAAGSSLVLKQLPCA